MIPYDFPPGITDSNVIRERITNAERQLCLPRAQPLESKGQLATAFHEAGHALFNEAFGRSVLRVTCREHQDSFRDISCLGSCEYNAEVHLSPRLDYISVLAAAYTEAHADGSGYKGKIRIDGCGDCADIEKIEAEYAPGGQLHQSLRDAIGREITRLLNNTVLGHIQAVAIVLFGHETLSGDQLREILTQRSFHNCSALFEFAERNKNRGIT